VPADGEVACTGASHERLLRAPERREKLEHHREMGPVGKHTALSRWLIALTIGMMFALADPALRAVSAQPAGSAAPQAALAPMNANLALQKARRIQRTGQLRAAEQLLRAALAAPDVDSPQTVGCLELLTRIYLESGRFDDARKAGLRYQQLLESLPNRDPVMVVKRQEIAVALAEIALAREDYLQAANMVERALTLPAGLRETDPLWEARVYALRARIDQRRADLPGAQHAWAEVESRVRPVLEGLERGTPLHESQDAAAGLLTQALVALERVPDAIAMREKLLTHQAGDEESMARNLSEIAACYAQLKDDAGEQRTLEQALVLAEQHDKQATASYASLLERLAAIDDRQNDSAKAKHRLNDAAQIYEALIAPVAEDDRGLELQMQYCQSLQAIYQRLGKWPDAIRVTGQLLEYRERTMLPDDPNIWRNKSALGFFYAKLNDGDRAKPLLVEAADYWRGRVPPAPTELARTLNNLAEVVRNQGSFTEALKYLEEAVPICRQIYAPDDLRLAEVYNNLASMLSAQGRYKAAIDQYHQGAEICRSVAGAAAERAKEVLATTLVNMAMLYKSQRQFREAARLCAEALEVQRSLADAEESSLVPFYSALASLYLAQDQAYPTGPAAVSVDLSQAAKFTQQAHDLCQQFDLIEQPSGIVVLQLEAMIHTRKAELAEGEAGFKQALTLAKKTRQASLAAKSLTYLGEIALRRGDAKRAAELAGEALKIHDQVQAYPNLRFMAYLTAARAAYALQRHDDADDLLHKAIDLIEAPRAATVGAESERAEYFSQFVVAFDLLVDWNVADKHFDVALKGAEQGRNRTFLDQVRAAGVDLRQSLRDTPQAGLLTTERQVLTQYHEALASLRQAYARTAPADEIRDTVAKIEALKKDYAQIETDIRDASPIYRNLLGASRQPESWDEIAAPILTPGNALVLYYLGHAQSHLFVVDGATHAIQYFPLTISEKLADRIGFTPGPLTRGVAAQLVTSYVEVLRDKNRAEPRRGVSDKTVQSEKGDLDLANHALTSDEQLALAEIVLPAEVRDHINQLGPRNVIVVPDGAVDQLPLEALLLSSGPSKYLLDVFPPITYAPSATIMAMLVGRQSHVTGGHASLLSVGNPAYGEPQTLDSYSRDIATSDEYRVLGGLLTPLPGTMAECRAVEQAIASGSPGADVMLLAGASATESNVRAKIINRRFVHLAAHGLVDQRYGNLFGAIALSPPATISAATDDGFLSLYEIHNLSLPDCDLMVLSSCETNVGADRPLEAGSTLARAFLAAGVRDVVCSQWSVDDAASASLVSEFFRNLSPQLNEKVPVDFSTALRDARRSVRNQKAWSAPYFWAPFVLVGPSSSEIPGAALNTLAK
jgi:CHAT domain-containing protein